MITSPFTIILTDAEQARLTRLACSARAEHRMVLRARIVLAAAQETSNAAIAVETGLHVDTVRKWRRRFVQHRLAGLSDRRRSGRPVSFTPVQVAEVKQLACTLPAETGVAVVALVEQRPGRRGRPPRRGDLDLGVHDPPLAQRGRDQTLAAPVLDLPPRPRLRGQGRPRAGPLRPLLGRRTARPPRLRHQRRREIPAPSPPPPPPRLATPTRPDPAGRVRVPPRRHPRLPGRLRRPPRPRDRTHRAQDRDRTVHPAGRAGDDQRALRLRATGCSGSSTTAPPTTAGAQSRGWNKPGRPRPWCTCRSTPPG